MLRLSNCKSNTISDWDSDERNQKLIDFVENPDSAGHKFKPIYDKMMKAMSLPSQVIKEDKDGENVYNQDMGVRNSDLIALGEYL